MSSLTGSAKQSKTKILVLSRIVRRQIISNRLFYCLSRDRKATTMRHGEKTHWDAPPDCLSFPSWRLPYVVSTWFDNVTFIPCCLFFLQASLWRSRLLYSALLWTVCWGPVGLCCPFRAVDLMFALRLSLAIYPFTLTRCTLQIRSFKTHHTSPSRP